MVDTIALEALRSAGVVVPTVEKDKCCWFPFKNAYMARQHRIDNGTEHLPMLQYHRRSGEGDSSNYSGEMPPPFNIRETPGRSVFPEGRGNSQNNDAASIASMTTKSNDSSFVTDDDTTLSIPFIRGARNSSDVYAKSISPTCISQVDLWDDEMISLPSAGPWSSCSAGGGGGEEEAHTPFPLCNDPKCLAAGGDNFGRTKKPLKIEGHLEEYPSHPLPKVEVIHEASLYKNQSSTPKSSPSHGTKGSSRASSPQGASSPRQVQSFDATMMRSSPWDSKDMSELSENNSSNPTAMRRAFCVRPTTDSTLQRPSNDARRKPDYQKREFVDPFSAEEKKEQEESFYVDDFSQHNSNSLNNHKILPPEIHNFNAMMSHANLRPTESQPRLEWMKSLAGSQRGVGGKPMLCGPQRVDDLSFQKRNFLTQSNHGEMSVDDPTRFKVAINVDKSSPSRGLQRLNCATTETTNDDPELWVAEEKVATILGANWDGKSSSPHRDLQVVRQTPSLVDMDSEFMASGDVSEITAAAESNTALQIKARPRSISPHQRRQGKKLETLQEGGSIRESHSQRISDSSKSKSRFTNFDDLSVSGGSYSVYSENEWDSDSSSTTSFHPPREITRVKSNRSTSKSRRPNTGMKEESSVSGKGGKFKSSLPPMPEKANLRLPSFGRTQQPKRREIETPNDIDTEQAFRRQPISALTTASSDLGGYDSTPSRSARKSRTNIGNRFRPQPRDTPGASPNRASLEPIGENDGDRISMYPSRSASSRGHSKFQLPRDLSEGLKTLPFQADRTIPNPDERIIRSPRSPRSRTVPALVEPDDVQVQTPLSPKSENFFDDLSDLGTDVFQQYQGNGGGDDDDDEDSLFTDLRSVDSSTKDNAAPLKAVSRDNRISPSHQALKGEELYQRARMDRIERAITDRIFMEETGAFARQKGLIRFQ